MSEFVLQSPEQEHAYAAMLVDYTYALIAILGVQFPTPSGVADADPTALLKHISEAHNLLASAAAKNSEQWFQIKYAGRSAQYWLDKLDTLMRQRHKRRNMAQSDTSS